jgi:Skp family chaperone for outer membrane proteins
MVRALYPLCLALALLGANGGAAQTTAPSPILVIDSERLFLSSDFGLRVVREIEARGNDLASENRQIEAELAAAEQELTNRRTSMTPEAFQPLADAFDTRVQETRQAQAAKSRALNAQLEREREAFLNAAGPVLQELMSAAGASVVLDRRTVFISTTDSDITAAAVARLNADLGQGTPTPPAAPADPTAVPSVNPNE